ncbi:hypothetical protein BEN71_14140 [Acinetobacter wuhouensis]|uniref:hypothetical protein n=1 Tax=Acinetobacter wuhouensis TaxID=1879050 RepID=UPI00083B0328|nr:hypothetical protein [Acinetobacter wuhouensis]AXQ23147.1 hypothetical protein BEN71_14140 [Acinetobacter wuhouensis]
MTTTAILFTCLAIFLVIVFYKLFFSQTDEIPTHTELKSLPPLKKTFHSPEINPNTASADEVKSNQKHIFDMQWDELTPKSIWGFSIAEPLRILISIIIYPFALLFRLIRLLLRYAVKILKFILEVIAEIFVELIFNIIIRGIFFLIKGFFLLIFRLFDGI